MKKLLILAAAAIAAGAATAEFARVPRAALKALKVTRGKPFTSGVLFIEGRYVPPPYVVERYGLALRVNGEQVTGPLIAWEEFLKTQEGVVVTRTETPAPVSAPAASAHAASASAAFASAAPAPAAFASADDDPLADLFDDDPAPKKPAVSAAPARPAARAVTTVVSFDGEFRANAASDALLRTLNQMRTDVDAHLRRGGFICFGSAYSRVTGDAGAMRTVLNKLPELMKNSPSARAFSDGIRDAGLVYFPEALNRDLYRNRIDYLKLIDRRRVLREEEKLNSLLNRNLRY
jgi:hypothetical protein